MPSSPSRQAELRALGALPFAHRGLHGRGIVENSRAAFAVAIARGHGIELDVQASRDGAAMVFHDAELERLTGRPGRVDDHDEAALARMRLIESDETIPPLAEILRLIDGRVPLLIEVKSDRRGVAMLYGSVARALEGYRGSVGVMSFNPEVGRWFARHAPARLRGLVVTEGGKGWTGPIERALARWRAAPDFLACDIRDLPSRFAARQRRAGRPVFTWTCREEAHTATAAAHADQIIYEEA